MGREIRMVPPNWEHPEEIKYGKEIFIPLEDKNYEESSKEWIKNFILFTEGKHPDQENISKFSKYYWEYDHPPDEECCRPYKDEDCSWFQVYENVSEGTPVTPPFPDKEELLEYLVQFGEFGMEERNEGGYSKEAAEAFVYGSGYSPSIVFCNGNFLQNIESCKLK